MVLRANLHELEAMRELARGMGADFRHDSLLNPRVDCGASRYGEQQVTAAEAVAAELSDPATRRLYEQACEEIRQAGPREPSDCVFTCGAGEIGFTVDPYGSLTLCQLARRASFDLSRESFARGWNEFLPRARARHWERDAVCRTCTLLAICGNCPGAAELELGDACGAVPQFCEITHRRAFALLGAASGHRQDASCCLGRVGQATASPLIQIERPRPRAR